jgi:predicted RNase H-like HicB family nuclease
VRFMILLTPDTEDGGYTVTVPGLPGCVTDGTTVEKAMERAKEAIELYFEGEDEESLAAAGVSADYILASVEVETVPRAG